MILLDARDQHSIHKDDDRFYGSTVRLPEQAAAARGTDSVSLPDYDTSEEQHKVWQHPQAPQSWRPSKTFWRAACSALAVYIVLSVAICTPFVVKSMRKKGFFDGMDPANSKYGSLLQTLSDGPSGDSRRTWDFSNITCQKLPAELFSSSSVTSGGKTYYSTTLQYDTLPIASHIRSNITRGDTLPGQFDASLTVDVANDVQEKLLKYQVIVNTTRASPLEFTTLCFSDQPDHHGLSIFPAVPYTGDEELSIHIRLTVPRDKPLRSFTTYLPDFTQIIGDVQARCLLVEGANKPITFQSPRLGDITVHNILAPVQGYLNVSNTLNLSVIKGSIDTDIVMYTPPWNQDGPAVTIDAIQSPVTVNLVLDSMTYLPTFVADIRSTNGSIDVDVTKTPSTFGPALALNIQNAMADTFVKVADDLNGWYDVESLMGSVEVDDFSGTNQLSPEYTSAEKAVGLFEKPSRNPMFTSRGQFKIRSSFGPASLAFTKHS
ncbi:hypothetical protein BKA70DRAFT_1420593 [Coprinopsis sp. MPI-PUGE-AT-0042]|nr:hypothetical protein BKA70DRAFT_1420593 [Coprinopsis sp. MPI-PUGE-AT-0042]